MIVTGEWYAAAPPLGHRLRATFTSRRLLATTSTLLASFFTTSRPGPAQDSHDKIYLIEV
jgi:hypothetical protein